MRYNHTRNALLALALLTALPLGDDVQLVFFAGLIIALLVALVRLRPSPATWVLRFLAPALALAAILHTDESELRFASPRGRILMYLTALASAPVALRLH